MTSLAPRGRAAVGAVIGLVVYGLTVTWPVTARPTVLAPSGVSALDAALIGAGLGAVGGLPLFAIRALRSKER